MSGSILWLSAEASLAASATWSASPPSNTWGSSANWVPMTVPNGPNDVATFAGSNRTNVEVLPSVEVSAIIFNSGASAFTITTDPLFALTLSGSGITNNSGITQGFSTAVDSAGGEGALSFTNSASAGVSTMFINAGGITGSAFGGKVEFFNSATASSASFINNAATTNGAHGGFIQFYNSSTANNATFTNNGCSVNGTSGGFTHFLDNSTAANGTFTNNGGQTANADRGYMQFLGTSHAGNGTFVNYGGQATGAGGGIIFFRDSSNADHGNFTNNPGPADQSDRGSTEFLDSSNAGFGIFINSGGTLSGNYGGSTLFFGTSTAGAGTFTNAGGTVSNAIGGFTQFSDTASAANASVANNGAQANDAFAGSTYFYGSSAAGNATFTNNCGNLTGFGGGITQFSDTSSAGNGTFINAGGCVSDGGRTNFYNNSTAGHGIFTADGGGPTGDAPGRVGFQNNSAAGNGTFTSNGATVASQTALGGFIEFFGNSTASSGTFTINGGAVEGANRGHLDFYGSSIAGQSTLIANGGPGNDPFVGGVIRFRDDSSGGTARVEMFDNASLNTILHNAPGVMVGSLEGTGNVFLGSNNLIVGTNNLSTSFSGFIDDSQLGGGFTKIGAGLLTLQGRSTNNYLADTVSLSVITGSIINLNFAGDPDRIRSLIVDGVSQQPGLYGGPVSGAANQLPQFAGPGRILATTQAVSRKVHGAAGSFDVDLPLIGPPGIECRSGGGAYQIVVNFFNAVTFSSASVTSGVGMVASTSGNGTTTVTINLTGVANAQTITVTLFNVNDGTSISNLVIPMAVLVGDTSGNGTVNASDVSQTKSQVGMPVSSSNFREDVNASGTISSTDVAIVKSDVGTSLPP